jgi:protein-disulfide isomerase
MHKIWSRRTLMLGALVMMTALASGLSAKTAQAQMVSDEQAKGEMSIGQADAFVTLHEYASLTCGHCAKFHTETLPEIKKQYVDTGKVRIVFHDFPLDGLAMGAVMIARCSGPDRFADFTDMLFQTQANWRDAQNPLASLVALARFYGLNGDDVNSCLNNQDLLKFVQGNRDAASSKFSINSTPTFILNGNKIEGAQPFDVFKSAFDEALAAHK